MPFSKLKTIAMSNYKNDLDVEIKRARDKGDSDQLIVKRLFYFRRSPISIIHDDAVFKIFNAVAAEFNVPFKSIYVSGSAQTGHSLYKNTDFSESNSDLDLAIVDESLFRKYSEISFITAHGYRDLTKFRRSEKIRDVPGFFQKNLAQGWFRPDLMPDCDTRKDWFKFFSGLTQMHIASFKDVNCGIYLSPVFFEESLVRNLNDYKLEKK
jgi:hypothetical protein